MLKTAYLAFGSNVGDGKETVSAAWDALGRVPGVFPQALSKMYITRPWGVTDQPDFINACGRVQTALSPEALLGACLGIEAGMGRLRKQRNGPRIIDIDLLLYEGETRRTEELTLPHPGVTQREFVLRPLMDVAPGGMALWLDVQKALSALACAKGPGSVIGEAPVEKEQKTR